MQTGCLKKKSFYPLNFSAKNKNSQHNLARLREISKVISVGVEGKKFLKRRQHDVLLVLLFLVRRSGI